jgi:hypothetical protein
LTAGREVEFLLASKGPNQFLLEMGELLPGSFEVNLNIISITAEVVNLPVLPCVKTGFGAVTVF